MHWAGREVWDTWRLGASVGDRLNSRTATKHGVSHFFSREGRTTRGAKHKLPAEREHPMIQFRA